MHIIANVIGTQNIPSIIIQRYKDMLNFVYKHLFKGKIILEELVQGFVIIADSFKSFKAFWGRYPQHEIRRCKEHPLENNFLLRNDLTPENFPEEGFTVKITFFNDPYPKEVGDVVKDFFEHFSDSIEVKVDLPNVYIHFHKFEDLKLYFDILHLKFKRVFPEAEL